jgi:hypothetical protein
MSQSNTCSILLAVLITTIVVGAGTYLLTNKTSIDSQPSGVSSTDTPVSGENSSELSSLLIQRNYYNLPFGATEIEGYYTEVLRETTYDGSAPAVSCAGFVITRGPEMLMNALLSSQDMFGNPPIATFAANLPLDNSIKASTSENPVKVLAIMNPTFEGGMVGCMTWPIEAIYPLQ